MPFDDVPDCAGPNELNKSEKASPEALTGCCLELLAGFACTGGGRVDGVGARLELDPGLACAAASDSKAPAVLPEVLLVDDVKLRSSRSSMASSQCPQGLLKQELHMSCL